MAGPKALTYERHRRLSTPKGPTARYRAKRRRAEAPVAKKVRAACVERDGYCRVETAGYGMFSGAPIDGDDLPDLREAHRCSGPSEWAHFGDQKRAKTRGMKPESRHSTAGSLMLCRSHHARYDGSEGPRLWIHSLTEKGADGPLSFSAC